MIAREEVMVGGEEPHGSVGVEYPVAPASRQAEFGPESPAVGTIINQLRWVVLAGRS